MYGAALRISEVLSLTVGDVDLAIVLTIRDSKFFKSGLVPIGPHTGQIPGGICRETGKPCSLMPPNGVFFLDRNAKLIPIHKVERAFKQVAGTCRVASRGWSPLPTSNS